jgi:hypothetical protein
MDTTWSQIVETNNSCGFQDRVNAIVGSDLPDIDKLKQGFGWVTERIIDQAEKEIELARAMQDRKERIKLQIKMSTMNAAREVFDTWYTRITGKRAWDE